MSLAPTGPGSSTMQSLGRLLLCGCLLLAASWPARGAQQASPNADDATAKTSADWPLERVILADGKSYQGLVAYEGASSIEFIEVRRPRGKPMFLVVRPITRKSIISWERLTTEQQQELRARLQKFKQRALIEGRRMEDLALTATSQDGHTAWHYQGSSFELESTADELMTRRVVVRLGQIFTAYRQLLPSRFSGAGKVQIRIFGSTQQYRDALMELNLDIKNPAVYLPDKNLILAGSELNRFDDDLAHVAKQHREIKKQLDTLVIQAPVRLKDLGDELKKNEVPTGDRLKILLAEQRKWNDYRKNIQKKIAAIDRKNAARFNEVAGQMLIRLAHEAFHAYLETRVYPRQAFDVPRWLNEGLAQTFEAGLLEADTLRVDAPNLLALSQLQHDLRGEQPLSLAELLSAGSDTFLSSHAGNPQTASRSYYYSWGLAYYLAFNEGILDSPRFAAYLSPEAAAKPPVERFEELVGMPLAEFEPRWRQAMLDMSANP